MEKVQILLYALASFFSTENPPILSKSAKIEINMATKQIVLQQYDISTIPQYSDKAATALEQLMEAQAVVKDLEALLFTGKYFYEEDGKLNASIYFQFREMRDLRAISMYFNAEKNTLSYPYMEEFNYTAADGVFDDRYVRFKADGDIDFEMATKETPELKNTVSLLPEWKKIEADKYVDVSELFSKKDFEKLRKFIFKNGDRRTFRNFDNNNPHYSFENFDVFLGTGDQRSVFENDSLKQKDFTELVIGFSGGFTLYLKPLKQFNGKASNFEGGKVYTAKNSSENMGNLIERLTTIKQAIK